jgi:uncharacterized protein (DUF433 family)
MLMSKEIVEKEGFLGGKPFLKGTRIRVTDIAVKYEELGYSKEELLKAYPRLTEDNLEAVLN